MGLGALIYTPERLTYLLSKDSLFLGLRRLRVTVRVFGRETVAVCGARDQVAVEWDTLFVCPRVLFAKSWKNLYKICDCTIHTYKIVKGFTLQKGGLCVGYTAAAADHDDDDYYYDLHQTWELRYSGLLRSEWW